MPRSATPRYAEAGAYATVLLGLIALGLIPYYRLTRAADRFAVVGAADYRDRRHELGRGRWLGGLLLLMLPALAGSAPGRWPGTWCSPTRGRSARG